MARPDWIPTTIAGIVLMAQNIKGKVGGYAAELGLTALEVTAIEEFCNALSAAYYHKNSAAAGQEATDTWFNNVLYGTPAGDASPPPTVLPVQGAISGLVLGWIATMRKYRREWVAASGYTTEIGEDLMIVASGAPVGPVTPILTATPTQSGYAVIITVTGRGDADFCIAQMRRKNGSWANMEPGFTGRTKEYTITPTTLDEPEMVEFRLQLMLKNVNYGLMSQTATVTIVP